jgi:hypothetical protein
MIRSSRHMLRARSSGTEGFALLDVIVAGALLAVSVVGVGSVLGSELLSIGSSSTQQTADGLLNQAMEEVRALPYQIVANGLSTSDATVASDPRIEVTGTAPNQTYTFLPTGESIPHAALSYTQAPFVPHLATTTVDATTFTVAAYPTDDAAGNGVYRVTIIVSWRANSLGGVSRISTQTLVYSESSGCLTATNHPFAAPCQPFFFAQASDGSGSAISVAGSLLGVDFSQVQLAMPTATSSMEVEQVSSVTGSVDTSGADITTSLGEQDVGSNRAVSAADNDPGTPGGASQTNATSQSGLSLSVGGGTDGNSVGLSSGWAETGTTTSTAAASSNPACSDLAGSPQLTGLPCGSASDSQTGSAAVLQTGLYAGTVSLLSAPLVSISASPSSGGTFVARYTTGTTSYCTNTTGDGCVHAGAQRAFGTIELAGLPGQLLSGSGLDGAAPSGWGNTGSVNPNCPVGNYTVALVKYVDSVSTESGVNANSAAATLPSGSGASYLCFWNGSGYTSQVVSLGSSPQAITIPTLNVTDSKLALGAVDVSIVSSVSLGTVTTTTTTPSGCSTPCQSSATVSSPIEGSITYQVTQGSTTIASLTIGIDLGDLSVSTSYQAAP